MSNKLIIFQPWIDAKEKFEKDGKIRLKKIKQPPCKNCESFIPRVKTTLDGSYDGVVLCIRIGGMMNDFSCFKQKDLENHEHTTFRTTASELMEKKDDKE